MLNNLSFRFFLILIFNFYFLNAQERNAIWVFGDSAGIDFNMPGNPMLVTSSMNGRGSCTSISDSAGNLMFYSWNLSNYDDSATFIANALHDTMENGSRMTGGDLYNQIVIIPFTEVQKYYVFHLGILTTYGLYYSIVEMSFGGGLGTVTNKNRQLNNIRPGDCLTAVKHGNGRDWWVIGKLSDNSGTQHNRFFTHLVTSDSVYLPIVQDFNDAKDVDFQKIIFNKDGNTFMLINLRGFMAEYAFDRCSGQITHIRTILNEFVPTQNTHPFYWEGAYSPDGNLFYASTTPYFSISPTGYLIQYDLTNIDIIGSADTLDSYQAPIGPGAVRLAPDDKIYFSRAYEWGFPGYPYPDSVRNYVNENLSVINSPDSLGAACDYQPFSFYLGGKRTYYGLPNNPNYDLGPLVGSLCDTLTIGIASYSPSKKISAYPNPFVDKIKFEYNVHDKYQIAVTDITGKKVYEASRQEKPELELSFLQQGLYFVTISDAKNVYQTKIIKH